LEFAAGAFDLTAQGGDPVDPHFIPLTRFTQEDSPM